MKKTKEQIIEESVMFDFEPQDMYDLVEALQMIEKSGMNLYVEYKGKKFYALFDNEESCYQKLFGMSKKEYLVERDKKMGRYDYDEERKIAEAEAKIPSWVERGNKFIYPQLVDEWKKIVNERAHDTWHGFDIESALDVMELLDKGGSVKQADDLIYSAGHSSNSVTYTIDMILNFSKRGLEFIEESALSEFFMGSYKLLDEIEERNKKFESELESGQPGNGN